MYGKKRQRPASADFRHSPNKKQQTTLVPNKSKTDDLWKVLSNVTEDQSVAQLPIDKKIKYSQVFIKITPEQRLKLPIFLADLKRALELDTITLYEMFIELKSFTLLEGCVAVTAILNYLHKTGATPTNVKYWDINAASLLRGTVLVHKSVKVAQTESTSDLLFRKASKPRPFKCQLATVCSIQHFKEIYLEGETIWDWMKGLLNILNEWKFRPVNGSVTELLEHKANHERQRIVSSFSELAFLKGLLDPEFLNRQNKRLIDIDNKELETFMTELQQYNEKELTIAAKASKDTKLKNSAAASPTNLRQKAVTATSRYKGGNNIPIKVNERRLQHNTPSRAPQHSVVSSQDLHRYCIATIKASISKVTEKSAFQIIKSYVKYPRSQIDLIYDNLNQIKSKTNCNVVILNLQTIHESNTWFEQLPISVNIDPPPSATRVISVGGVGGKCKVALEMILTLLETGSI